MLGSARVSASWCRARRRGFNHFGFEMRLKSRHRPDTGNCPSLAMPYNDEAEVTSSKYL